MNLEQLSERVLEHHSRIAAIDEKLASAHKRIDENDRITDGIHKLASNMEALTLQVKHLTERMDSSLNRIEAGQKAQGERIGALEKTMTSLTDLKETVEENSGKIDAIEKEPANKWNKFTWLVITAIATAIIGFILARLL